eukprot:TRINITY_DN8329_c0_g1_i1.p1 TRINITY_DN8329_c0_g1~~TRINITY_DN8329_c0_g1_i1.p1  ORF type:complete len:112 (-),score=27.16 TRINITY_DN8329_c0_g1_i1:119-421(-)
MTVSHQDKIDGACTSSALITSVSMTTLFSSMAYLFHNYSSSIWPAYHNIPNRAKLGLLLLSGLAVFNYSGYKAFTNCSKRVSNCEEDWSHLQLGRQTIHY